MGAQDDCLNFPSFFLLDVVSVGLGGIIYLLLFVLDSLIGEDTLHCLDPSTGELQLAALVRLPQLASMGCLFDNILLSIHLL
ncbi:hypothetical protein ACQP3F_31205, partial [Escherichia coli]